MLIDTIIKQFYNYNNFLIPKFMYTYAIKVFFCLSKKKVGRKWIQRHNVYDLLI